MHVRFCKSLMGRLKLLTLELHEKLGQLHLIDISQNDQI